MQMIAILPIGTSAFSDRFVTADIFAERVAQFLVTPHGVGSCFRERGLAADNGLTKTTPDPMSLTARSAIRPK